MTPEVLRDQVDNYKTLKVTQSYRGVTVLIFSGLLLLSLILGYLGVFALSDAVLGVLIYIPVLLFVYLGHRWAMVLLMIFWTIDKVYTLYLSLQNGEGFLYGAIIWWLVVTPYVYRALLVENERRRVG